MLNNISNCFGLLDKLKDHAPLILRLVTGVIFAMHGYQKFTGGVGKVAGFLDSLGFPAATVFAVILIAAELLGGIALILGVFTRYAAKILAVVAVVALFTVHIGKGFFIGQGGYEFILLILAATISILITGPGKWALDNKLGKGAAEQQ